MKDIRYLEKVGYTGPDACIAASLFDYGMIWRKSEATGDYHFYYTHPTLQGRFDTATFSEDEMTFKTFDWANKEDMEETMERVSD